MCQLSCRIKNQVIGHRRQSVTRAFMLKLFLTSCLWQGLITSMGWARLMSDSSDDSCVLLVNLQTFVRVACPVAFQNACWDNFHAFLTSNCWFSSVFWWYCNLFCSYHDVLKNAGWSVWLLCHDTAQGALSHLHRLAIFMQPSPIHGPMAWHICLSRLLMQICILQELKRRIEEEQGIQLPTGPDEVLPPLAGQVSLCRCSSISILHPLFRSLNSWPALVRARRKS